MQPPSSSRTGLAGLITLLALLPVTPGVAWGQDAACPDVAERGHLNLLTINLLFSEVETRSERLAALAEFIAPEGGGGAAPLADVILLQEVVGGVLAGTGSSARDLQRLLAGRGVTFELRTATWFSLPGLLTVGNATLSRCDIRARLVEGLPPAPEFEIGGEAVEIPRNVLLTRIDVPGFGRIEVYNIHLCAGCTSEQRGEQLEALLEFVAEVEGFLPGVDPVVLGGDFNIDIFREDEEAGRPLYDDIIAAGFTDAYAEASADELEQLCEATDAPDEHCTIGVSALSAGGNARRIDYIFTANFGPVLAAEVVFDPLIDPGEPTVSDHSGVLVRVALPGAEPLM